MGLIRGFFRFSKKIICLAILLALAGGAYLVHEGHELYRQALVETPVEDVMAEIQNKPGYVTLDQVPKIYRNAVIATEDHRFYVHDGLDYIAIFRAFLHDIQAGEMAEGGSTITQQLAKNQFFTQKKMITRKIAEVYMVKEIEQRYSKEEILELYLNSIYYGEGYYCLFDASMGYFGKPPMQLTDYECVLLAGIPNAPSVYAPTVNPELAGQRQQQVLQDMVKWGYLTKAEAEQIVAP